MFAGRNTGRLDAEPVAHSEMNAEWCSATRRNFEPGTWRSRRGIFTTETQETLSLLATDGGPVRCSSSRSLHESAVPTLLYGCGKDVQIPQPLARAENSHPPVTRAANLRGSQSQGLHVDKTVERRDFGWLGGWPKSSFWSLAWFLTIQQARSRRTWKSSALPR